MRWTVMFLLSIQKGNRCLVERSKAVQQVGREKASRAQMWTNFCR